MWRATGGIVNRVLEHQHASIITTAHAHYQQITTISNIITPSSWPRKYVRMYTCHMCKVVRGNVKKWIFYVLNYRLLRLSSDPGIMMYHYVLTVMLTTSLDDGCIKRSSRKVPI
jgi:hypothetical protein